MKEKILERAIRNGVKMPDGRRWTWRGYDFVTNQRGVSVRVEIWSSACRWCGAEFQIKQKLLWGETCLQFSDAELPRASRSAGPAQSNGVATGRL